MRTYFITSILFLLFVGHIHAQQSALAPTVVQSSKSVASMATTFDLAANVCNGTVKPGNYFLVESFFVNFDYAVRRAALLKAAGCFQEVTIRHTDCQPFDIKSGLYIICVSPLSQDKETLYRLTNEYYQCAADTDLISNLINLRIAVAK